MIVGFDEKVSTARAAVGQTMVAFKSRWNANACLYHAWPWKILAVALFVFFAFACLAHSPASPLNRAAGNRPRMTKRLT
ncbi:MAG: hypothetical protein KF796_11250 [Ramlibacter sp.]|nr:hypothetical protein [Ramlibacter sp.]